jgi:hypothetical protein
MEIRESSLFAAASVAIAAALFVFALTTRALAFAPFAVFTAGGDVGARGALFEALIEAQWRANEIESGAQAVLEEAPIAEVQRLQLIREKNECGRRRRRLRDVEDLYFAVRR